MFLQWAMKKITIIFIQPTHLLNSKSTMIKFRPKCKTLLLIMISFNGYVKNAMIKFPIYYASHMHNYQTHCDFMNLYEDNNPYMMNVGQGISVIM